MQQMFHTPMRVNNCMAKEKSVTQSSKKTMFRILPIWVLGMSLVVCFALFAQAPQKPTKAAALPSEANKSAAPAVPGAETHDLTAEDLGSFLDGLIPLQIQRADIAGAVVAVTKDGKLLFAKGYGYSDVAKKAPVNPETTLFRPGSISKTFTWTAVMQQVEQGKLDLDRDVNDYLDFKVPPKFGKPITLRNIMTHTSGFEETLKDLFVGTQGELRPIDQYLREHMPERVYPPGTTPSYSNYATTLAAYIVQRVSGQDIYDYFDEHFFKPLDMHHATFRQPLPPSLLPDMSSGYVLGSGESKHFEWVQVAPAGSASASAVDMTHWMIMHLQNGKYGDVQILKPETAIAMHARQQGPWPDSMNAMCLGFYEESQNGHRIIGHGGDTLSFHSDLHLLLNDNVGFFVSYNSPGRDDVSPRGVLFDKFMERYFPAPPANPPTLSTAADDAKTVAGSYSVSRRFETNVLSVITLLGETKIVINPKDNTIAIKGQKDLNGQPKYYREIGPMLFEDVNGHDKLAFTKNYEGRQVFFDDFPFWVFQRVTNPFDSQTLNYWLIGFSLVVVVLTIIFWPIGAVLRKHYAKPLSLDPSARRSRMLVRLVCFGIILFCIGFLTFVNKLSGSSAFTESADFGLHLLQFFGLLVGLLGSIIAIYNVAKTWAGVNWLWYKLWSLFQAMACVFFFWFIWHWHLLNFHLNY
jgi:CubicO group peptidase (beta-lactamase class C family)